MDAFDRLENEELTEGIGIRRHAPKEKGRLLDAPHALGSAEECVHHVEEGLSGIDAKLDETPKHLSHFHRRQ